MRLANRHIKPINGAKGVTAYEYERRLKRIRDEINAPAEKPTAIYVPSLHLIFASAVQYKLCLELLEHVEVTKNNKCILTERKAGRLLAAVRAIKNSPGFLKTDYSLPAILIIFNKYLDTSYLQISQKSKIYKESISDAERFLKKNYKK
jgi:hypothetical protein